MALLVEAVRSGEPGRTGAYDGHVHSRAVGGDARNNPPFLERPLDDGVLDALDGHGGVDEARNTGTLTWGGAHAASELREVVGLVGTAQTSAH